MYYQKIYRFAILIAIFCFAPTVHAEQALTWQDIFSEEDEDEFYDDEDEPETLLDFGHLPADRLPTAEKKLAEYDAAVTEMWDTWQKLCARLVETLPPKYRRQFYRKIAEEDRNPLAELKITADEYVKGESDEIRERITDMFREYPAIFDPAREPEYWRESADELLEVLEHLTTFF